MYIEDTADGDSDITITVNGEEYTSEANHDLDGDGVDDAVAVLTENGHLTYVDEDGDGEADLMQSVDQHGTVLEQARYRAETGDWVGEPPDRQSAPDDADGESLVLRTPDGERYIGPPTEDTDGDGVPDTAVVSNDEGTVLVTDADGDGIADQVVRISDSGTVLIDKRTAGGEWQQVEQGGLGQDGEYRPTAAATDDASWTFDDPGTGSLDHSDPGHGVAAAADGGASGSGAVELTPRDEQCSDDAWA